MLSPSALGGGGRKSRARLDGAPWRLMVSSEEVEMKVCLQTSVWAPPLQRPAAVWEGPYPEGTVGCGEEQQAGAWHQDPAVPSQLAPLRPPHGPTRRWWPAREHRPALLPSAGNSVEKLITQAPRNTTQTKMSPPFPFLPFGERFFPLPCFVLS